MATAVQSITVSQDFPDEIVVARSQERPASLLGEWSVQTSSLKQVVYPAVRYSDQVRERHRHRRLTKSVVDSLRAQARGTRAGRELHWIALHRPEYAGQWVALVGERLVAHGNSGKEVFAAVAHLAEQPIVVKIDEAERLPFGGW